MHLALAQRLLLVCLALLVAMQCVLPRGVAGFSRLSPITDVGQGSAKSPAALKNASQDLVKLDASSSASMPDYPDETHGALAWEWSLFRPPHVLNGFISGLSYNAQVTKLLRPPRA